MASRDKAMTDLRETVARAICNQPGSMCAGFCTASPCPVAMECHGGDADAAITAMQTVIAQARREALEEAVLIADEHAATAQIVAAQNGENSVCGTGRQYGALFVGNAIRALIEKEAK